MLFVVEGIGDGSLKLKDVLDFVDSGHDLILAANVNASDFIRNIASECGVDFEDVSESALYMIKEVTFLFFFRVNSSILDILRNLFVPHTRFILR